MTVRYFLCFLLLGVGMAGCATAKTKKKPKGNITLIEAYNKKLAENEAGNPPMTGDHFLIKWNGTSYPETFFWRGQGGWLTCKIERAHKFTKASVYSTEATGGDMIHKGDTLMLSPITGGRFAIPAEIPATAKNTLFYKTGGSQWLSYSVNKISKK